MRNMLKKFLAASVMLSLSFSSLIALGSNNQNEIVLCPPVAQCPDNIASHCTVGGTWRFSGSDMEVPGNNYKFSSAYQTGAVTCNYTYLHDGNYSSVSFFRNDLRNFKPLPGNMWRHIGTGTYYFCNLSWATSLPPSECPSYQLPQ